MNLERQMPSSFHVLASYPKVICWMLRYSIRAILQTEELRLGSRDYSKPLRKMQIARPGLPFPPIYLPGRGASPPQSAHPTIPAPLPTPGAFPASYGPGPPEPISADFR